MTPAPTSRTACISWHSHAAAAIPTYLGLSVVVPQSDPPLTVTSLAVGAVAGDICTSLHLSFRASVSEIVGASAHPLRADHREPSSTSPRTWPGSLHAHWATSSSTSTSPFPPYRLPEGQLRAASDINQAIGVLIGHGYSLRQAHRELDTQAADNRTDRHSAARLILDTVTTSDDDGHPDIH